MTTRHKKRWHNVTIEEIVDERTGKRYDAPAFIESLKGKIPLEEWRLRNELAKASLWLESNYVLTCFLCSQPVRLRGKVFGNGTRDAKTLHFTHARQNVKCPYHDGDSLSKIQINRIRFHGQREGPQHRLLKNYLEECLLLEQSRYGKISDVRKEKIVRSDEATWRKPDLNFSFGDKHIAIDLQLSTTYLDVILERQKFYRTIGTYMLWIFDSFELDHIDRVYAKTDVLINNNENAYVFDHDEYLRSVKNEQLSLYCYYLAYHYDSDRDEIRADWNHARITLDELTFDEEKGYLYYYNSEKSREDAIEEQKASKERLRLRWEKKLQLRETIGQYAKRIDNLEEKKGEYDHQLLKNKKAVLELLEKYRAHQRSFLESVKKKDESVIVNNALRTVRLVDLLGLIPDKESDLRNKQSQYDKRINELEGSITRLLQLKKYFQQVSAPITGVGQELVCVSNTFPEEVYFVNRELLWTKHRFCKKATKYGNDVEALKYDLKNADGHSFIYMSRVDVIELIERMAKSQSNQFDDLGGEKRQSSDEFLQYVTEKYNDELNKLRELVKQLGNERRQIKMKQKEIGSMLTISQSNLSNAEAAIEQFSDIPD